MTKWGTKQGILVLGRELPVFVGAGIGAGGNAFLARGTVRASRRIFN